MYTKLKYSWLILLVILNITIASTNYAANCYHTKTGSIAYTVHGSGQPLVLIHAFPVDQTLWQKQITGLKQYFKIITLDLWGFGQSQPVDRQAVTMDDYAQEVSELLTYLQIDRAIIGGESMGGYIALAYLANYPSHVAGLILADTQAIADSEEVKVKREQAAQDILANGPAKFIEAFIPKALSKNADSALKQWLQTTMARQAPSAYAAALRGMAQRLDLSAILANSVIPILIISGDEDAVISPTQSQAMHSLAKNSRLLVLKQAGHLANLQQPNQWNQAVIEIFTQQ
jgi:pimeloyl-ACP methyl ester carboxylesterase